MEMWKLSMEEITNTISATLKKFDIMLNNIEKKWEIINSQYVALILTEMQIEKINEEIYLNKIKKDINRIFNDINILSSQITSFKLEIDILIKESLEYHDGDVLMYLENNHVCDFMDKIIKETENIRKECNIII